LYIIFRPIRCFSRIWESMACSGFLGCGSCSWSGSWTIQSWIQAWLGCWVDEQLQSRKPTSSCSNVYGLGAVALMISVLLWTLSISFAAKVNMVQYRVECYMSPEPAFCLSPLHHHRDVENYLPCSPLSAPICTWIFNTRAPHPIHRRVRTRTRTLTQNCGRGPQNVCVRTSLFECLACGIDSMLSMLVVCLPGSLKMFQTKIVKE